MKWTVETLNEKVDEELEKLQPDLKVKFLHIAKLLESFGPRRVGEPYVKSLGNKLWEIRMKGKSGIARAVYIIAKAQRIFILHAFVKKTQKTPKAAIEVALKRQQEAMKKWLH
jgi:phage-related protein